MKLLLVITLTFIAAVQLSAESLSFDFADPKGVNTITFNLDGTLESISGNAKGIAGRIKFDPKAPEKTSGTIQVDAASLYVSNP
jgi:polyisoprenoid-binding protein YceI